MSEVDTHRTPIRFPSIVAVVAFAGFCVWLGGEVREVRRDITDLKGKHIYTPDEIKEMVDRRVDERWQQRKQRIRLVCAQFQARGQWGDCTEVTP